MITHGVVVVVRWRLLVVMVLLLPLSYGDRVSISCKKLDDVHNYLKGFNKPPLKSIKLTLKETFYGAKGTVNVWEPIIQQPNEFSLSQLWILRGSFASDLNSIEASWQSDAYPATGCYNLLCSGFVQINNEIAMGASTFPISAYDSSQYDISLLVWKDPKEGNWWMQFGNDYVLGYWPAFLFSYLADSASMIEWGGEVVNSASDGQHATTQMGSGHFPEEGFGKASYFRNIQIVDGSNNLRAPKDVSTFTEQSNCYDIQIGNNGDCGNYFYYGGPGRNPNCPLSK